jgi:hypothetical protein
MVHERILKYVVFFILCLVISVVYTSTKRSDLKSIVRDSAVMAGYICGGMVAIGLVVYLLCQLK